MPLSGTADLVQRLDEVGEQLAGAVAFCRLLCGLDAAPDAPAGRRELEEARSLLKRLGQLRRHGDLLAAGAGHRRFEQLEARAVRLLSTLAERDDGVPPSSLRFSLGRGHGEGAEDLVELVKFYLHLPRERPWTPDHVDKVDLLITKLGARILESGTERDPRRLHRVLAGLRAAARMAPITEVERKTFRANIAMLRVEVEAVDSLDVLIDGGIIPRYRSLKHRLGHLLLHPDIVLDIVETNLALRRRARRLYSSAKTGIFSTYQGIFDIELKGPLDRELKAAITQLHLDFDRFEQKVKGGDVRLQEVGEFWRKLRVLSERLVESARKPQPAPAPLELPEPLADEGEDWLREDLTILLEVLQENDNAQLPPDLVAYIPHDVFQLDSREVIAYRRLASGGGSGRELELFVLKAAALRRSIKTAAAKLAREGEPETYRALPSFRRALQAVQLAEAYLTRYSQAVDRAILDGDIAEAQTLQILRMRLMREFSGIWLQVYRPE